jgi:hypothetical protein
MLLLAPSAHGQVIGRVGSDREYSRTRRKFFSAPTAASGPEADIECARLPHQKKSLRLGRAFAQTFRADALIESHVLASHPDVQPARDLVRAELPLCRTRLPVRGFAA